MENIDYKELASKIFCFAAFALIGFLFIEYALGYVMPFLIAWAVAYAVRPMARELSKRLKISQKICAFLLVLLFVSAIFSILFLIFSRLFYEIGGFLKGLVDNCDMIADYFGRILGFLDSWSDKIAVTQTPENDEALEMLKDNIALFVKSMPTSLFESFASAIPGFLGDTAAGLPNALLFALITLISCFYFSADIDYLHARLKKLLPKKAVDFLVSFKRRVGQGFKKYIRAYLILFAITFAELFVGLLILDVKYAIALSILISFVDFLPVFGTPAVLIPWGVIALIMKNNFLGIGLLILCAVTAIIRQVIEPKILGKSLGVHPLIFLVALYLGYRLFGFFGMILLPILALVLLAKEDDTEKAS